MNSLKEYLENFVLITKDSKDRIKTGDLLLSYSAWQSEDSTRTKYNQRAFNLEMKRLGFAKRESNGNTFFSGLKFKPLVEPVIKNMEEVVEKEKEKVVEIKIKDEEIKEVIHEQVNKLRVPGDFIKFKGFVLHHQSYSIVKGKMPDGITYLFEIDLNFDSSVRLLTTKKLGGLDTNAQAKLYVKEIMSFLKYPVEQAVLYILATGLQYSRLTFHRDLLIFDTYDDLCSSYNSNPV
jgi:hypothetical protein